MIISLYFFMHNSMFRVFIGIVIYILMAKYLFNISLKMSVIAVGVFYIVLAVLEILAGLILVRYFGISSKQVYHNAQLSFVVNLMFYSILSLVVLACAKLRKKIKNEIPKTNPSIYIYVIAALIVSAVYAFNIQELVTVPDKRVVFINIAVFLIFVIGSTALVLTNYNLAAKHFENIRLKSSVDNISELKENLEDELVKRTFSQERLRLFACTDGLTGIYNRRTGLALFEKCLDQAKKSNSEGIVFFIDIDHLKEINDTYGHRAGDELIITAVRLIKKCLRKSDVFFRFGGDEFMLILPDCDIEKAKKIWKRINQEVSTFNIQKVKPYIISMSYGCAQYDWSGKLSADELIAKADQEMYKKKKSKVSS